MIDFIEAVFLGIVQGLTEFLPISSTAHLIIFEKLFGSADKLGLPFDVALHFATALAVIIYFRKDWMRIGALSYPIIIGTIPAALFGFFLQDLIEEKFRSIELIISGLVLGSVLIIAAEAAYNRIRVRRDSIGPLNGLIIGLFQALALIPGISRSGATISAGLLLGKERALAARFSFLLATPIIIAASAKKLVDLTFDESVSYALFGTGFAASFFSGLIAIHLIISMTQKQTLLPFVVYRLALAFILALTVLY